MTPILDKLLDTPWGKSFIGAVVTLLVAAVLSLFSYSVFLVEKVQAVENEKSNIQKNCSLDQERLMREHLKSLQALIDRQDQIEQKIKKRR